MVRSKRPNRRRRRGMRRNIIPTPFQHTCQMWEGTIVAGQTIAMAVDCVVGKNAWRCSKILATVVCESTKDTKTGLNVNASSVSVSVRGYANNDRTGFSPVKVVGLTPVTVSCTNRLKQYWVPTKISEHVAWIYNTGNSDLQYSIYCWYTEKISIHTGSNIIERKAGKQDKNLNLARPLDLCDKDKIAQDDISNNIQGRAQSVVSVNSENNSVSTEEMSIID